MKQLFAALFFSSLIACTPLAISACDSGSTADVTTSEMSAEEEETTDPDESEEEYNDDIPDDTDISKIYTDSGYEYDAGDYYVIVETEETEPNNNLGPYVFEGDFNHSTMDDYAQQCASKGWPIEVLTAADLNLTDSEFAEGFVAYDISEYPHYYIFYKDHDTAYKNLEDVILGDDAHISHVVTTVEPDTYWVEFDNGEHMMDVSIYENGFAIFDDNRVTTFQYDPDAPTNPSNITYDTPKINELVKEYVEKKYKLSDLPNSTMEFPNAVEGFTGYGWYWPEESDYVLEDYEIYVIKFNNTDEALSDLGAAFNRDFSNLADDTSIYLEFDRFGMEYTGSISSDGLLILKGVEKHQ